MAKIRIVETSDLPICPHCEKQLDTIERISKGFIEQTMVYICCYCKKVLSIGYNMGW